jgi:hypothetical protein
MITSHLSSVWALLATLIGGFVLGAVVHAAYAKWKLRRDFDLTGGPEPKDDEDKRNPQEMSDEELSDEFDIWSSKRRLRPEMEGHLLRTALPMKTVHRGPLNKRRRGP